jgi:hypothetical protein
MDAGEGATPVVYVLFFFFDGMGTAVWLVGPNHFRSPSIYISAVLSKRFPILRKTNVSCRATYRVLTLSPLLPTDASHGA